MAGGEGENQDATLGESVDFAKTAGTALATGGASLAEDPMATLRAAQEAPKVLKKGLKWQIGCCGAEFVMGLFVMLLLVGVIGGPGSDLEKANAGTGGAASGSCMDIQNGTALSSGEIDKLIAKNSEMKLLKDGGKAIYDAAKKQKVNPLLSFGIANHESNFGQVYANNPNSKFGAGKNMFGMDWASVYTYAYKWEYGGASGKHKVAYFHSWADGLNENMALLRRAYFNKDGSHYKQVQSYVKKGEDLTEAVLEVYSPYSDGNNPGSYSKDVRKQMRGWCKELGIDPDQPRVAQ